MLSFLPREFIFQIQLCYQIFESWEYFPLIINIIKKIKYDWRIVRLYWKYFPPLTDRIKFKLIFNFIFYHFRINL